jgi:hypothetical protein
MLERRVWIDMNIFVIYPNTFIVFVADSGRMRKSTAIKMTRRLLAKTDPGPRLVAQKITPEALIDSLKIIRTDDEKGAIKETCGGLVVADELVTFINRDTYERGLGSLMIELWDCPDKYEYRTRSRPVEEINYGHISLLGGTTVHSLRDAIPLQALGDGFSSRVIFVYVDETPVPVPRPVQAAGFKKTEQELILQLQSMTKMNGEVTLSPTAIELFDQEYRSFFKSKFYDDAQFQAYASRRDKHLLKIAMCLMAAEDPDHLQIDSIHLEQARHLLSTVEAHFSVVFDRIAMTEVGSMTERVYATIRSGEGGEITRAKLLHKFSHKINAMELSKIIETLKESNRIEWDTSRSTGLYYKVVDGP